MSKYITLEGLTTFLNKCKELFLTKITNSNKLPYSLLSDTPTIPTVPTNVSAFNNDSGYLTLHLDISGKLDAISDLDAIRRGAALGDTALLTELYTGTYSKPSGGIPKTDLASAVLTSLGKADTALLSLPSNAVTTNTDLTIDSNKVFNKSISGNLSITWNLLVINGNFVNTSSMGWSGCTITVSDNVLLINPSSTPAYVLTSPIAIINGHKYIARISYNVPNKNKSICEFYYGNNLVPVYADNINTWETKYILYTCVSLTYRFVRMISTDNNINKYKNLLVFDVTTMFGAGNEPTLEEFKFMFPLDYYKYNTGSTIEKALIIGSNLSANIIQAADKIKINNTTLTELLLLLLLTLINN